MWLIFFRLTLFFPSQVCRQGAHPDIGCSSEFGARNLRPGKKVPLCYISMMFYPSCRKYASPQHVIKKNDSTHSPPSKGSYLELTKTKLPCSDASIFTRLSPHHC